MKLIKTKILPIHPTFAKVDAERKLDLKAICVFAAIGFFLDEDTYWKDAIVLKPASVHELDDANKLLRSTPWFEWHYTPRDLTFNQALEAYATLFETIIKEQTKGKKVILPLSGGLDSRTQAVALKRLDADVFSYSYSFKNGYAESKIAEQISQSCDFDFKAYTIEEGYLWSQLDELAQTNRCYSDFTTPRQMALNDDYATMGDVFSLGHWGDVLFDSMNLPQLSEDETVDVVIKKIIKRGGLEFASKLWEVWGLDDDFESYLRGRISQLLSGIKIEDTNAKLRAFKSMYWAPRWTSVNLSIFNKHHPIGLPYYDERMCQLICTIPEAYLSGRQLQIAYIQSRAPALAKITWEAQRPFNLNNYTLNKGPYNLPYRISHKLKRTVKDLLGAPYVQRNWELQFLGKKNEQQLKAHLFNDGFNRWVPKPFVEKYYDGFTGKDALGNAHALNMLLVLSQFYKRELDG